jgi:uncharacterized protein YjbJ (UPF0337 family)
MEQISPIAHHRGGEGMPQYMRRYHYFIKPSLRLIIMSNDEVKGKRKQIEGQIREDVGKLTGNKTEQVKGKIKQVEGKVQEEIGKAKRKS